MFLVFAGMLYYVRNKLKEENPVNAPSMGIPDKPEENKISDLKSNLPIMFINSEVR